jgi:restriction system protein
MPIPDYQSIMLPLLKYASDQKQHSVKQAYEDLANEFNLTTEEKNELLPSGTQQIYKNRIGWARTYLSGDGGIDGIIKEDKLGLDLIYIQAKRWDNVVSRPEIQKFVGALQGKRAKKGIFNCR